MSKRQKGRRHRKVNRTPRPVGPANRATATRATAGRPTTGTGPAPAPATDHPADRPATPAPRSAPAPAAGPQPAPEPAPAQDNTAAREPDRAPDGEPQPGPWDEAISALFRTPARDGGLGQSAARTWEQVRRSGAAGTTVEELAAGVGYQSRTILRHLQGLAEHGIVEQHAPDRWRPVRPEGAAAPRVPQHA
ncbi:helix-turn-helix domain-containing protein [Streptomyces sp. enrichment culture]|uniref:helix-turn-helix domain-containing protein n=1 Tax=Streptomyces sp. enrichment culture TaxID=1795815 RepID=UPI003F57A5B4